MPGQCRIAEIHRLIHRFIATLRNTFCFLFTDIVQPYFEFAQLISDISDLVTIRTHPYLTHITTGFLECNQRFTGRERSGFLIFIVETLIIVVPVFTQLLHRHTEHIYKTGFNIPVHASHVQEVRNGAIAIRLHDIIPERSTCKSGFLSREVIEVFKTAAHDSIPHTIIFHCGPAFRHIRHQTIHIPLRQVQQDSALQTIFNTSAIHQLVDHHLRNTRTDLLPEMPVITIEIHQDFIPHNPRQTTGIGILLFPFQTDIALLQIRQTIINHKLETTIDPVIE